MRIAIIGSGPAGFYAAEALLKRTDIVVHVDMFDRLPTPYGLVRGGVAPDHQNIKAVIRVYEKTAARPTLPQGLIGSHRSASAHVVAHMIADGAGLAARELPERNAILSLLRERGVQIVSFTDWKQLDDVEVARGERRDAPRDKIVDVETMLAVLAQR